jgi:transcriptional regulator with XRE-family HTH domain
MSKKRKQGPKTQGYAQLGPEEERIRKIVQGWYQASGMSQSQVGEKIEVSQTHVSAMLVGRSAISLNVLPGFCKAFGKEIADLYSGKPNKVSDPETEKVMKRYRPLNERQQKAILNLMESYLG